MVPGATFTTLCFLRRIHLDQKASMFVPGKSFQLSEIQHTCLLTPFESHIGSNDGCIPNTLFSLQNTIGQTSQNICSLQVFSVQNNETNKPIGPICKLKIVVDITPGIAFTTLCFLRSITSWSVCSQQVVSTQCYATHMLIGSILCNKK